MKKLKILCILLCFILFMSCSSNNTSQKALEDGKIALASLEYEKAKSLFKLAVDEDENNSEANSLLDLVTNYIKLIDANENNDFEKVEELVLDIESNDKLNLISDSYEKLKKNLLDKREMYEIDKNEVYKGSEKEVIEDEVYKTFEKDVIEIEKLLKEGKYDEVEEIAYSKLEEVEAFPELAERVCNVISVIREKNEAQVEEEGRKIEKAKEAILAYHYNNTSIIFWDMMTFDSSSGCFAEVAELKGKTMYHFMEEVEDSPTEYVYDDATGDVFKLVQGQVFWMNNGEKHLN